MTSDEKTPTSDPPTRLTIPHLPDIILTMSPLPSWLAKLFSRSPAIDVLGQRGENLAARHLRNAGMKIIERNFRCPIGEIDIIAREGATLVFVEVKTRVYDDPAPEEQVNTQKQHRVTKAARFYLTRYGVPQPAARFDVVAIVWPRNQQPIIRHTPCAFDATF